MGKGNGWEVRCPNHSWLPPLAFEELLEAGVEPLWVLVGHEVAAHDAGGRLGELRVAEGLGHVGPVLGDVHERGHGLGGRPGDLEVVAEDGGNLFPNSFNCFSVWKIIESAFYSDRKSVV